MLDRSYQRGDTVVFRKTKVSTRPGPRARDIHPSPRGEQYSYHVDKFWVVLESSEAQLVVGTRRGKRLVLDPLDPQLRRARWWEHLLWGQKFPTLAQASSESGPAASS